MENNLIIIIGKTSVGKSLLESIFIKNGFNKIISYTTRFIRKDENDGIDYYYCTNNKFDELIKNNELVAITNYNISGIDTRYGISINELNKIGNKIMVINPKGLINIIEHIKNKTIIIDNLAIIELSSKLEWRIKRYLARDSYIYSDLVCRLLKDEEDFNSENDYYKLLKYSTKHYFEIENNGDYNKENFMIKQYNYIMNKIKQK
jgi:guanylate kinase